MRSFALFITLALLLGTRLRVNADFVAKQYFLSDGDMLHYRIYVTGLSMGGFATWDIIQRKTDVLKWLFSQKK